MDSNNKKRRVITVAGEDAKLVMAAEEVDLAAEKRAWADAKNEGAIPAMIFYETERERAIMQEYRQLQDQYQFAYGLPQPPLFTVASPSASAMQRPLDVPCRYTRNAPTDMELAQILLNRVILRRLGETVFLYNGCYFERLSVDKFHALIYGELRQELSINGSSKQLKSVAAAILAEPTIEVANPENSGMVLCLQNGILNLGNFMLTEHTHKIFFTWKLNVSWCGPQACPVCDQFIETAAGGDPILIQRFWEVIGYVLVPDNRAKRFVLFQGLGDTGKSVLGSLIKSFFEPQAVGSVDIFKLGDRFSLATLVSKRVNISMDLSDSALNEQAVSIIKQVTGRDLVQVEEKYKAPYSARIDCKLIFGTNHILRVASHDSAFLRRVLYLPFNYPLPKNKQDPDLRNRLEAERPGILFKALRAYQALVARGYTFCGDDIYDFNKTYQPGEQIADQVETLEQFVQQHCIEAPDAFVATDMLYEKYLEFCKSLQREGISNKQVFSSKFNGMIKHNPNITLTKKRINGIPCNGYKGILLNYST